MNQLVGNLLAFAGAAAWKHADVMALPPERHNCMSTNATTSGVDPQVLADLDAVMKRIIDGSPVDPDIDALVSPDLGPEGVLIVKELTEKIRATLINCQKGTEGDIARLWFYEGCSGREIARKLHLDRRAVQRSVAELKRRVQALVMGDR
jgi:hypothetical protein